MTGNGTDPGVAQWNTVEAELARLKAELARVEQQALAMRQAYFFDRFHAFDGIKNDCCPACGGRVRVDDSDPIRVRIVSDAAVRAS